MTRTHGTRARVVRGQQALRSTNRRLLLLALSEGGETSRADLARLTGLSGTTVSSLVAELVAEGVVSDSGRDDRGPGRTGRPGRLVRLADDRGLVIGLDLTDDAVRAVLGDLGGRVLGELHRPIDPASAAGDDELLAAVEQLLSAPGVERHRLLRVVVGVPGVVDPTDGTVVSARHPRWGGTDWAGALGAATGVPVVKENDSDLCVIGEIAHGAARGLTDVVHLNASFGIGLGLVLGGRVHRGVRGGAGEVGHIEVADPGELCPCGNRGCLETVASLRSVLEALRVVHPDARTGADLERLVAAGDRPAVRAVTDAGDLIGKVVAEVCNTLAPQAVVVGGLLGLGGTHLVDAVRAGVHRYCTPRIGGPLPVLRSELGERAIVLGALAAAASAEVTAGGPGPPPPVVPAAAPPPARVGAHP